MIRNALQTIALAFLPLTVFAHEGHGMEGTHWHSTDVWGFVVTAALIAAAVWFSRKK